jgi:hypothetical protein
MGGVGRIGLVATPRVLGGRRLSSSAARGLVTTTRGRSGSGDAGQLPGSKRPRGNDGASGSNRGMSLESAPYPTAAMI